MDPPMFEAKSKEKHGVWDPMAELTIASPYVHSRVDSNTCQSRLCPSDRDFGFGLGLIYNVVYNAPQ